MAAFGKWIDQPQRLKWGRKRTFGLLGWDDLITNALALKEAGEIGGNMTQATHMRTQTV